MADTTIPGAGINVGDAILTFIGDTTDLERAWSQMEETSKASATRTMNDVLKAYDDIGIKGSARLRQLADDAQAAFLRLRGSGVASMTDIVQAEQEALEATVALKQSLGESIPLEVTARIQSLSLQYVAMTGTVEEFESAQMRSVAVMDAAAATADRNAIALKRDAEAAAADTAAYEKLWAAQNAASANNYKGGSAKKRAGGAAESEEEESALAAGAGAVMSTAKSLALYAGIAAVAGSLAEGVKQSLAFDAAFAELSSVLQAGGKEDAATIAAIKQELLDLPPVLGDVTTLTKGVYQAISAGIPAGEAVQFVAKAAIYARAALTDQETAVKLVSASLNAYGLTAQDAEHVTSALFATIKVGVLRGPELAESLGRVLPVAANLKVSFSEVLAAASTLTKGGLSADESMTALRQTLSAIEKPSSEATKAIKETGTSFAAIRAEIREKGLAAALADLATHIQGNTQLTTELFPNIRALTGVLSLTGGQAKFYAGAVRDINEAYQDGTQAQTAFQTITGSLDGQLKTLGTTMENQFIGAFTKLQPIINSFGPSLKAIVMDSGLLKVVVFALVAGLLTLAVVLNTVGVLIDGVKAGAIGMAYAFEQARFFTHAYAGSAEDFQTHLKSMKASMDEASKGADDNRDAIKNSLQAFDDFVRGNDKAANANRAYGEQLAQSATTQDAATAAAKKANDELVNQQREAAEAAQKQKDLEEQIKKTTKAMEQYANAHGIPLYEELSKNVTAARQFANEMRSTNQPIATQVAAILNLNQQLGKLQALMNDKRSIGEYLSDLGSKDKNGQRNILEQTLPTESQVETYMKGLAYAIDIGSKDPEEHAMEFGERMGKFIMNPIKDAFDVLVAAEESLGIKGTATLTKQMNEAAASVAVVEKAFKEGRATAQDLVMAQEKLAAANTALDLSFSDSARKAKELQDAEDQLGIKSFASISKQKADTIEALHEVEDAYDEHRATLSEYIQAQLKAAEATRDWYIAAHQPIPDTVNQSILNLTNSLRNLDSQMNKNSKTDQDWYNFWHTKAPSVGQNMHAIANMGEQAFMDFSSSFGSAVQQIESGQKSIGAAIEEAVAKTLIALSSQAAVQALYYTALGIAATFTDPAAAGAYFAAAAEFGVVAAVAGAAGALMSGGGSSSSSSGSSPSTSVSGPGTTTGTSNPAQVQNVVRFGGGGLITKRTMAMIGDNLAGTGDATEAVLPLDDPRTMGKLRDGLGGSGDYYHFDFGGGMVSNDSVDQLMDSMSARVQKGKKLVATTANRVTRKS